MKVLSHPILRQMNLGDICPNHAEKVIAIGLAAQGDFEVVPDGVCRPCEQEAAWDAIPLDQRITQVDDRDGTIIAGDPRNPHLPALRIEYPVPGRSGGHEGLSERGKRMREMVQAFERAYPTADERRAINQPDASINVKRIRDLKPRRPRK
jgi:hypothetical protein